VYAPHAKAAPSLVRAGLERVLRAARFEGVENSRE
jgi:hypothetical protein